MINFKIKIAEMVFELNTNYEDTRKMCLEYLTDEKAEAAIFISEEDLRYEKEKSIREAEYEGIVAEDYSQGYLETIAVYRKIAEYIAEKRATVFHGSLICFNGEGYLFTGRSGIGKTTHVNNWLKMYPDCVVINGDKPILKMVGDEIIGYGTPWSGKENLNTNTKVKLKAIIMVTRDQYNHIEEITLNEALPTLLSSTYRSSKPDGIKKALQLAVELGNKVKLYKLGCNMDVESAKVAYEGMNEV